MIVDASFLNVRLLNTVKWMIEWNTRKEMTSKLVKLLVRLHTKFEITFKTYYVHFQMHIWVFLSRHSYCSIAVTIKTKILRTQWSDFPHFREETNCYWWKYQVHLHTILTLREVSQQTRDTRYYSNTDAHTSRLNVSAREWNNCTQTVVKIRWECFWAYKRSYTA